MSRRIGGLALFAGVFTLCWASAASACLPVMDRPDLEDVTAYSDVRKDSSSKSTRDRVITTMNERVAMARGTRETYREDDGRSVVGFYIYEPDRVRRKDGNGFGEVKQDDHVAIGLYGYGYTESGGSTNWSVGNYTYTYVSLSTYSGYTYDYGPTFASPVPLEGCKASVKVTGKRRDPAYGKANWRLSCGGRTDLEDLGLNEDQMDALKEIIGSRVKAGASGSAAVQREGGLGRLEF